MTRSLPLVLLFAACTPTPYRLGMRAASEGDYHQAAKHWLTALDEDIYAQKPRMRLSENAETAWNQLWSLAQEHEASGRYAEAVGVYETMREFEGELESVELLTFRTGEARAQHLEAIAAWARQEDGLAEKAALEGRWADADAHYTKVGELAPETPDLARRHGLALRLWAEEDLQKFRYLDAATHFRAAFVRSGDTGAEAWAAAVEVALGRHALSEGKCRAAVGFFELAGEVLGDAGAKADRQRAEDCARLGLVVEAVSEEVGIEGGATALAAMFVDLLEERLSSGSRFVRLLAPDALDVAKNPPANRHRVSGRITQAAVEPPVVDERVLEAEAQRLSVCDKVTLRSDPEAVCTEPVEIEYTEHTTSVTIRIAGSVRIADLTSGEQQTRPMEVALRHEVVHASGFRMRVGGTTVPIDVGETAGAGRVAVEPELAALNRPAPPLEPENLRLAEALRDLATRASAAVLEAVDLETPYEAPKRLDVRAPKLLPEDFAFEAPVPEEKAPPPVMTSEPLEPGEAVEE